MRLGSILRERDRKLQNYQQKTTRAKAQGAKEDANLSFLCVFLCVLRLCAKILHCLPMAPNRFALFQKRFHAFVRVFSLHQLVRVNVLLLGQHGIDRPAATEVQRLSRKCQRGARELLNFASTSSSLGSR